MTKSKVKEKKIKLKRNNKSIKITEDIWFYQNPRSLDFVVWQKEFDGNKICVQFKLLLKKLGI